MEHLNIYLSDMFRAGALKFEITSETISGGFYESWDQPIITPIFPDGTKRESRKLILLYHGEKAQVK